MIFTLSGIGRGKMMRLNTAFGAAQQPQAPLQRSPRRKVVLKGVLEAIGGTQQVAVRNLSATGAMVEGVSLPAEGREVILKAGPLDCFCRVAWSEGNRCGLAFDEPIAMAEVLALHGVSAEEVRRAEADAAAEWFLSQGAFARM